MKNFVTTTLIALSLATTLSTPVRAAEVSIAAVVGMVATMATVGGVLSLNPGALRADLYQDAVDALALEDATIISPVLAKLIEEIRNNKPELSQVDDLTILAALVEMNQ